MCIIIITIRHATQFTVEFPNWISLFISYSKGTHFASTTYLPHVGCYIKKIVSIMCFSHAKNYRVRNVLEYRN